MGISILLWKISMLYEIIKKEITDKVNQLRYNLCENKGQMVTSSRLNLLPATIDFFSYKLSDLLINYLNSSIRGYKMRKIGIKIILYYFCNIPIRNPPFLPSKNSKCSPEKLCILLVCKGVYFLFVMIFHI